MALVSTQCGRPPHDAAALRAKRVSHSDPPDSASKAAPAAATPARAPASTASAAHAQESASRPPAPERAPRNFVLVHERAVDSIAAGKAKRVAILSEGGVFVSEGAGFRELARPALAPDARVELFFGRDDQPRLMGFVPAREASAPRAVYLRYRHGHFQPEPSELGPLASPRGALYGVLGFEDPEVVCRPRALCLVKRLSGWSRVPAHEREVRLVLTRGVVFALHEDRVERLTPAGFVPLEPARAFVEPSSAWLSPSDELWIVDRSAAPLVRLRGGAWTAAAAPVAEPRAVLGRSDGDVYVVGSGGAAHFDGTSYRPIDGVRGPLHLALAAGGELLFAGNGGVYREANAAPTSRP